MTVVSFEDVVVVNAVIVTVIGLGLVLSRKERKSAFLNLKKGSTASAAPKIPLKSSPVGSLRRSPSAYAAHALAQTEFEVPSRELNCFFNWNGHPWDAYEVLGVPAGSSHEEVKKAFREACVKNPSSHAFFQEAYNSIHNRQS